MWLTFAIKVRRKERGKLVHFVAYLLIAIKAHLLKEACCKGKRFSPACGKKGDNELALVAKREKMKWGKPKWG